MNKQGYFLIIFGVLIILLLFLFKMREDYYINIYVKNEGTCFLPDGTCLHEDRNFLVYIFGSVLSVALILMGFYLLFEKNIKKQNTKPAIDLLPDEKIVYEKIIESDGTIFQSELTEKTNYSKVKITRILDKLEAKGLIERKRRGMTNVVIMKKIKEYE